MSRRPRQHGFTLVELLVAIAVFAVMAGIAYSGLSSVVTSRDTVDAALDRSRQLQMALWRLQQDIEQTVDRPVRDRYGDQEPAVLGGPNFGLSLTRGGWSNPLGEKRSTLQRVHYQLDANGDFIRRYFRVLDLAPDSTPVSQTLLTGVQSVEWRFMDQNGQWQNRWPPDVTAGAIANNDTATTGRNDDQSDATPTQPPPVAVELILETKTWGRLRLLFEIPGSRP